jgi:predicted nucleotidyltransferase
MLDFRSLKDLIQRQRASSSYNQGMESQAIESKLRQFLATTAGREGIAAAYLFGSMARGTAGPASDVDVGILYSEEPPRTLKGLGLGLEGELEKLLQRPVQVVVLNRAPVDLVIRVLRDGRLLIDRDRSKRVQFEVRSRNEFWDLEPILQRYRRVAEGSRR